jgi:hypothetical protein
MKFLKYAILLILVFSTVVFFAGCNAETPDENEETETPTMTLITDSFIMRVGETAIIVPVIDGPDSAVIYTSQNENIAAVSNGVITAQSSGSTTIIVSLKDYPQVTAEVTVNVRMSDHEIAQFVLEWAKTETGSEITVSDTFPTSHPDYPDAIISYQSSDPSVIDNSGKVTQGEYDAACDLDIIVKYNNEEVQETVTMTVVGYAFDIVATLFFDQFKNIILRDYTVSTANSVYPEAQIAWSSSNTSVFTNEGRFREPLADVPFAIIADITINEVTHRYQKDVTAKGVPIYDVAENIKNRLIAELNIAEFVDRDLELPLRDEYYNATLQWTSDQLEIINQSGFLVQPAMNKMVNLKCEVVIGEQSSSFILSFEVAGKAFIDKWAAAEALLNQIAIKEIKTQKYGVVGVGIPYDAYNNGYIPFYVNEQLSILNGFVDPSLTGTRPGYIRSETRWVVIHDTANNNPGADAEMHARYIQSGPGSVSWHYTVDSEDIYQHLPDNEVAWHAGTHDGNYYGIGIETCINPESDYNMVMRKTAKLAAEMMIKYGLTLYDVRQHNYFSGKDCPRVMRSSNRWTEFLNLVAIEYFAKRNLQGVDFEWKSLSPSILDNTGKVYNHPGIATDIQYQVTITYEGVSKTFNYTSKLLPQSWL